MRNVTWAISNLCRGAPIPPVDAVRVAYPFLLRRIKETTDEDTLNNACWTISYLSDADNDRIQELIDIGFLDPILKLFATTENESLRTPCVRIIGNILSGDEHKVQLLLDSDILSIFHTHLHLPSELQFKKEIFWSVSNITAGSSEQLQYVLNIGILETIMKLSAFAPSELQKEAIFCVSNATYHATPDQMKHLIQIGVVEFLSGLIKETPIRMLSPVLEGLLNILRIEPNCLQLIEMRYLRRIHFLSQSREVSLLEVANNLVSYFPDSLVNEILAGDDREDEMELEATNSDEDVYHGEEEEDDDDEEEEEEEVISIQ